MAGRIIGRLLRPAVFRWRAFWDVDHRASNFMTAEEYDSFTSSMAARHADAEKEAAFSVARRTLLQRLPAANAAAPVANGRASEAGSQTDANDMVHLLWSGACALPVLLYLALCLWSDTVVSDKELSGIRLANRMILDKRVEAIEEALATDARAERLPRDGANEPAARGMKESPVNFPAGATAAVRNSSQQPGALASASFGATRDGAARGSGSSDAAVYHSFMSGVEDELRRRKEAMRRPVFQSPAAVPFSDDGVRHARDKLIVPRAAAAEVVTLPEVERLLERFERRMEALELQFKHLAEPALCDVKDSQAPIHSAAARRDEQATNPSGI